MVLARSRGGGAGRIGRGLPGRRRGGRLLMFQEAEDLHDAQPATMPLPLRTLCVARNSSAVSRAERRDPDTTQGKESIGAFTTAPTSGQAIYT